MRKHYVLKRVSLVSQRNGRNLKLIDIASISLRDASCVESTARQKFCRSSCSANAHSFISFILRQFWWAYMYEIEEKSFHFATYLSSLLYDVLSGLICASKYERDCDKWSRPTLISLPERQGIGKLSTLRLRGRNPGKRSGNTPRSRITRFTLFLFCFFRKCVCVHFICCYGANAGICQ